jgi:hypothetical protein
MRDMYSWKSLPSIWHFHTRGVMLWMRADPLREQVGEVWALEIDTFLGPVKWHWVIRRLSFGAQKSRYIKASYTLVIIFYKTFNQPTPPGYSISFLRQCSGLSASLWFPGLNLGLGGWGGGGNSCERGNVLWALPEDSCMYVHTVYQSKKQMFKSTYENETETVFGLQG